MGLRGGQKQEESPHRREEPWLTGPVAKRAGPSPTRAVSTPSTRAPSWTAYPDALLEREARIAQANGASADPLAGLVGREESVDRLVRASTNGASGTDVAAAFAPLLDETHAMFLEALDTDSTFAAIT